MKMKKYLMTGIAALALCAGFTSCSHDIEQLSQEEIDQLEAKKTVDTYKRAFEQYIGGKVASNQTWGFSGSFAARTRTENANANEWADPNKDYGGLLVPPAITPTQAAVVKTYFQTHPDLDYDDPKWTNYFIQQVYKGHTSVPEGCATPEEYTALNGTTKLIASDYMDHLAAIDGTKTPEFVDHINNFNHGDCGENDHVLDNGGNANDGPFHTDKIMYMKNSTTKSFGYYNSNGSLRHTEYTALVGWKTIHDWAVTNYPGYDGCLNDTWNRSFMGFDFEQMIDDQCYATKWVDGQEVVKNLTINEYSLEYYVNGEKTSNYVYQYNNQPVKMLSDQMNRYCGEKIEVNDAQLYSDYRVNGEYLGKQLNTDFIDGLLADGYLPIDNKSLREWAIVGGCADGYFSDWIVTLTEAKIPTKNADLRVMAEDLTNGTTDEDFDFNDIVFDVYFGAANTAKIVIKAAGGTLDLRIARVENPTTDADWSEVHALFASVNPGVNCAGKMINTHGTDADQSANVQRQSLDGLTCPEFTLPFAVNSNADAKKIKIQVKKGGNWVEITSEQGEPAAKFAVPHTYGWMKERTSIKSVNESFTQWCTTNNSTLIWVGGINE